MRDLASEPVPHLDATETPYVRTFIAFLGMSDIEFVYAEGLAISEASKQQALARAQAHIDAWHKPDRIAA